MTVSLWSNKRNEAVATVYENDKAIYSVTFDTIKQRDKFVNKNHLTIV